MTDAAYVYSGYVLTAGVLGLYAAWVISRSRALRRRLRDDR